VCLSESAGRKTPKDEAIIAKLQALQPSLDRHKIFDELLTIKHNDTASTIKFYILHLLIVFSTQLVRILCIFICIYVNTYSNSAFLFSVNEL